jgi:hypothetical protein
MRMYFARSGLAAAVFFSLLLSAASIASANENVVGRPSQPGGPGPSTDAEANAFDRELDSPAQLSPKVRSILALPDADVGPEAFGSGGHPFTTQRASILEGIEPINSFPWRATGKLLMAFGNQNFVCTASVVGKSLLVTAAHCVHNFGEKEDGFADAISFEPARHENDRPFGTWTAKEWWIPKVYFDGNDVCSAEAPGIVCENDVAVIVLDEKEGQAIGDAVGMYKLPPEGREDDFGFVFFLGQNSAHFTQLGYPSKDFDGDKMIRTDSLGYHDDPNNVILGSNQTGGSSGGPWLQNFGTPTSSTGPEPSDAQLNTVTAVTSWGFTSGTVKVQGASRFSKNQTYTEKSNVRSLIDDACSANSTAC